VTRPAAGPLAYVVAHRIAVVDELLAFEEAYCLSRLVLEHRGGPFVPERSGTMSLKLFKSLAAEDLVLITSQFSETLRPEIALTISSLLIQEHGSTPPVGVRVTGFAQRRRNVDRYAEASEAGVDMVAVAMRAMDSGGPPVPSIGSAGSDNLASRNRVGEGTKDGGRSEGT
jgi:hypothetical protein